MYYKINVAKHGRHFFGTGKNSLHCESEARTVYNALKEKFTEEEGYSITCSLWRESGTNVDFDKE